MSSEVIQTVHKHSSLYLRKLNPPVQNISEITLQCRENLRRLADRWRMDKLGCDNNYLWEWDNKLEELLLPLISSYEADQKRLSNYCTNDNVGEIHDQFENELIISSIHRYVPKDFIFKSYPIQLFHCNPQRILRSCLRSQLCRDILGCRGDHVRFALGVRVYSYAENATVTWVILACNVTSTTDMDIFSFHFVYPSPILLADIEDNRLWVLNSLLRSTGCYILGKNVHFVHVGRDELVVLAATDEFNTD
ncbi:unnamed protein product [Trichobilharzia regenti]|nr:unnamed protein product [Trichobilharzia regenti]